MSEEKKANSVVTREAIIASAAKMKTERLTIEEWGGDVIIRELTGKERDTIEAALLRGRDANNFSNIRSKAVAKALIDENGNRLFDDNDIELINNLSSNVINTIFEAVNRISGMGELGEEDAAKN